MNGESGTDLLGLQIRKVISQLICWMCKAYALLNTYSFEKTCVAIYNLFFRNLKKFFTYLLYLYDHVDVSEAVPSFKVHENLEFSI